MRTTLFDNGDFAYFADLTPVPDPVGQGPAQAQSRPDQARALGQVVAAHPVGYGKAKALLVVPAALQPCETGGKTHGALQAQSASRQATGSRHSLDNE